MKNLLLCLCCLLATASSAQCINNQSGACNSKFRIGVKAGVNMTDYKNGSLDIFFPALVEDDGYFGSESWFGYHLGIEVQYMFTKHIGISSGLTYSEYNVRESFFLDFGHDPNSYMPLWFFPKAVANPSYLHLPINFLYKFDFSTKTKFYPSVGVYLGYGLGGKTELKTPRVQTEFYEIESLTLSEDFFGETKFQRFDAGLGAGLTLDINHFSIGVTGKMGLINAVHKDDRVRDYNDKISLVEFGITLGYFF